MGGKGGAELIPGSFPERGGRPAGGKMDAPVQQRIFWCGSTGLVAITLLLGGGMSSLQALTISIGLPFCLVLLLMCVSIVLGLREESRR